MTVRSYQSCLYFNGTPNTLIASDWSCAKGWRLFLRQFVACLVRVAMGNEKWDGEIPRDLKGSTFIELFLQPPEFLQFHSRFQRLNTSRQTNEKFMMVSVGRQCERFKKGSCIKINIQKQIQCAERKSLNRKP